MLLAECLQSGLPDRVVEPGLPYDVNLVAVFELAGKKGGRGYARRHESTRARGRKPELLKLVLERSLRFGRIVRDKYDLLGYRPDSGGYSGGGGGRRERRTGNMR